MFTDGTTARRSSVCAVALTLIFASAVAAQQPPDGPAPNPPGSPPPSPDPPPGPEPAPPPEPPPVEPAAPATPELPPATVSPAPTLTPAAPSGTPAAPADEEPESDAKEAPAPLRLPFTLQTSVGQGSFVADEHARNAYFGYSLTFAPSYTPYEHVSIGLLTAISQELTDSDGDTERQEVLLSDTRLSGGYDFGKIPEAEIGVTAQLRFFLPSSIASRHQTLVLGTGVVLGLSREFGPISLGLSTSFRKNFHRYTTPVIDDMAGMQFVHPRTGSAEVVEDGLAQGGTNNVSHSVAGELSVGYSPFEALSFGIAYGLSAGFTYRSVPLDELSGVHAEEGVGQRDLSSGTISASYKLDERFSFGAGVSTVGPPLTADNKSPRFPFWDFESEADNLTSFYLDATFTESLGK